MRVNLPKKKPSTKTVLRRLLSAGYFARELPPPFVTSSFAKVACSAERAKLPVLYPPKKRKPFIAAPSIHTLPRLNATRRRLGIPNPISQLLLSEVVASGMGSLRAHWDAGARPFLSASRPMFWPSQSRAFVPRYQLQEMMRLRLRTRAAARYVVHTDVAQFYGSIYTHSVPWALLTKEQAKLKKNDKTLLGNQIDVALRNGQGAQTVGIPIGPDTSLLVAETVLRAVDNAIVRALGPVVGFRYIDDYELAFPTLTAAERALSTIEASLHHFELNLNAKKTRIEELPAALEQSWVHRVREAWPVEGKEGEIHRLAAVAFENAAQHPEHSVLKFALASLRGLPPATQTAARLAQAFAFNAISASPSAVSSALGVLGELEALGHRANRDRLGEVLAAQLGRYVSVLRPNEVAWALWGALAFNVPLNVPAELGEVEDDVVALLALDGIDRGLWSLGTKTWGSWMTSGELCGPHWLAAYEANIKGWLPSAAAADHVLADPCFATLKAAGVHFYDRAFSSTPSTPAAAGRMAGGTIGDFYP